MFTKTFALLHRGLRHDARLLKVHLLRLIMVVVVVGMLFLTHVQSITMGSPGLSFFREITWITFAFATLAGATFFATAITEEKEEQTLGLLALANISPLSLIMGKFLPRLLGALLLLSALFPFTLLSITLGGVTWGQLWAAYWTLFAHVILLGTMGLLCSVMFRRSWVAVRMTGLCVLAFLALPQVVNASLSSLIAAGVAVPAAPELQQLSASAVQTSAIPRIVDIMRTGFDEGPFGLQVVSNLAGAVLLFFTSWALFAPFNSTNQSTTETSTWIGRGARLTRSSRRCWRVPMVWKDFHYQVAGPVGWSIRGGVIVAAAILIGFGVNSFQFNGELRPAIGRCLMATAAAAAVVELLLTASALFPAEIRQGTWPGLVTLPASMGRVAFGKVGGVCLGLVPAAACVLLGGALAPEATFDLLLGQGGQVGFVWVVLLPFSIWFVVLLHLVVLYSLLLNQWAAVPMAVLTMFIANCVMGPVMFVPAMFMAGAPGFGIAEFAAAMIMNIVCLIVAMGISFGLQMIIVQRLRVLAGR